MFDACLERCRDLYDSEDGYQRHSVVRFVAALYPRLAFRTVGTELTDEALPGDWALTDIATHRRRLREFYLTALVDRDGRVRQAAVKALKELAVTTEMIGAEDELQTMLSEVEGLGEDIDDEEIQKHIDQACENVAFHAEKPGSLLPEGLCDALE
jgi:hypothetical protein